MQLHSPYLNPFQPFPERELDGDEYRPAIENNMSRAVFSALANADGPSALASFLQQLAAKSPALQERVEAFAAALRSTDSAKIEFGLQSWPADCVLQEPAERKLLIGISSSHATQWTHDTRLAPVTPLADAWIYVPGQMLLIFECKNDSHPLDATQMSSYVRALGLVSEQECIPWAQPGSHLDLDQAPVVQAKCKDRVLDASWEAVAGALEKIQNEKGAGDIGRWLSGQAATYIRKHVRPPYQGVQTILEWLSGEKTPDRYDHLRTLFSKMGEKLDEAGKERGTITFTKDGKGRCEVFQGVSAAVYVRLCQGAEPVQIQWLGKVARLNLLASFSKDLDERIGLDFYVEATGVQSAKNQVEAWNEASARQEKAATKFEAAMEDWVRVAPAGTLVDVKAVRFKGKKMDWHGGGELASDGPSLPMATPAKALEFLKAYRDAFWRFPTVDAGGEFPTIDAARPWVRKPALSKRPLFDIQAFAECGNDPHKLQAFLRRAVENAKSPT